LFKSVFGCSRRDQRLAGPNYCWTYQRADPLPRSITVDLPTVLLRDLLQLSNHLDLDDETVCEPLVSLVASLQAAVPSYRALHLTIVDIGHPVSLTAFIPLPDKDSITTSLRVGFAALSRGLDGESSVVFYAATPGAFVDLAADFGYALRTPVMTTGTLPSVGDTTDGYGHHGTAGRDGRPIIVLDVDLPPPTTMSGLVGLDQLTTINRAVGMLIDQGHHPNQAHAALLRHAAEAGVEPYRYAARLLQRSAAPPPPAHAWFV
jgi:hypothetical protein